MEYLLSALGQLSVPLEAPLMMQLTPLETERAQAIKAAVEASTGLSNLRDFEYGQYALADSTSSLQQILHRIEMMQAFREEYKIQDTLEEGLACLEAMLRQQPGETLRVHYLPQKCFCVAISDWASFYPSRFRRSPEQQAIYLKGRYYRLHSLHPTFLAIREGAFEVVECDGLSWENFDEELNNDCYEQLLIPYPKNYKAAFFVNSNTVVNIALGLSKKYMNQNMKDTLRLGHQIGDLEGRRISEVFPSPDPEGTTKHIMEGFRELLASRYHYQATFQLPPCHPPLAVASVPVTHSR